MQTATLRPTGNGTIEYHTGAYSHLINWDTAYAQIDEESVNDADYFGVSTDGANYTGVRGRRTFVLQDAPAIGIPESVTIYFRGRANWASIGGPADCSIQPLLYTHSQLVYGNALNLQSELAWITNSQIWTTNPVTGQPWTWEEINALEPGVELYSHAYYSNAGSYMHCSWLYVEIACRVPSPNGSPQIIGLLW